MKTRIVSLVAVSLVATTSFAEPKISKTTGEGPGVAAGAVIGTIVGGPVGFVVGGGLGGWLSNKLHRERKTKEAYQVAYAESEAANERAIALVGSLEEMLSSSESENEQMRLVMHEREDGYRIAMQEALDIEVYFRTGESTLDERVVGRVERLGKLMQEFDDFAIVVEGHADPRGEEAFNEQLSAERAASVRAALIASGLPADRISTRAAGERDSGATEGDLDAMALERRVDLSIVQPLPRENRVARQ
jgi:outer membrane protein OmpA-like peptidoglycan-associated protein